MHRHRKPFLLAALAVAFAVPAAAQQQPGQMMQQGGHGMMQGYGMRGPMMGGNDGQITGWGPMMMGRGGGHMMGPMMGGGPATHVEGRLAFLKTELGITDAQEDAWNSYADAVRISTSSMQQMHDTMMSGDWPSSFPERTKRREQLLSAQVEAQRTLREAALPLYQTLDEGQKKIADSFMGMGMM